MVLRTHLSSVHLQARDTLEKGSRSISPCSQPRTMSADMKRKKKQYEHINVKWLRKVENIKKLPNFDRSCLRHHYQSQCLQKMSTEHG